MPHIIVKMYKGKSDADKQKIARKIADAIVETTGCSDEGVSVAMEEYAPGDWAQKVYKPDIMDRAGTLVKAPGYTPFGPDEESRKDQKALTAFVRQASQAAAREDTSGMFSPMSWLDLELEDNPQSFDPFFDTPWDQLSDSQKAERMKAVRQVL